MNEVTVRFSGGRTTIDLIGPADGIQECLAKPAVSKNLVEAGHYVDGTAPNFEVMELALDHAWNWFALHADQRMKSVHFFILTLAFLTAAYVTALRFAQPLSGAAICLAGIILTICFSRFDIRIRELLTASEEVLEPIQDSLALQTGIASLRMTKTVKVGKRPFTRYSKVIRALHFTAIILFLAGIAFAVGIHLKYIPAI